MNPILSPCILFLVTYSQDEISYAVTQLSLILGDPAFFVPQNSGKGGKGGINH